MMGMRSLTLFVSKLLLRPWDLSHRVECQKLLVTSWGETSVRVQKGGFMVNTLIRSNFGPNVLLETFYSYIYIYMYILYIIWLLRNLPTCFENMMLSLRNTSVSRKDISSLRKYDLFVQKYDFFEAYYLFASKIWLLIQ